MYGTNIQDKLEAAKNKIIGKYLNEKKGSNTIAKEYGCSHSSISRFLKKHGIQIRHDNSPKAKFVSDKIIKRYNDGVGCYKIAQEFGLSPSAVNNELRRANIQTANRKSNKRKTPLDDNINVIKDMYLTQHKSLNSIAKKFQCQWHSIKGALERNGTSIEKRKFYKVNENFFNKIDTEEKSYILGLWYADGNVRKNNGGISIGLKDYEMLTKIKEIMGYDGSIYTVKDKNPKHAQMYTLHISKKRLGNALIEKGCVPNKSLVLKFPTVEQVSFSVCPYFIRGYFDGDGSISQMKNHNNWTISIAGTQEFLAGIVKTTKLLFKMYEHNNIKTIMLWKKQDIANFLSYIYKDATIYLERKFQKALEFFRLNPELDTLGLVAKNLEISVTPLTV